MQSNVKNETNTSAFPAHPHTNTGWHLRKEISLSHILTTLLVIVAVMKFGYDMSTRITVLETQYINEKTITAEIKRNLDKINDKLDKLIGYKYES